MKISISGDGKYAKEVELLLQLFSKAGIELKRRYLGFDDYQYNTKYQGVSIQINDVAKNSAFVNVYLDDKTYASFKLSKETPANIVKKVLTFIKTNAKPVTLESWLKSLSPEQRRQYSVLHPRKSK